jgi:hypothetical protein
VLRSLEIILQVRDQTLQFEARGNASSAISNESYFDMAGSADMSLLYRLIRTAGRGPPCSTPGRMLRKQMWPIGSRFEMSGSTDDQLSLLLRSLCYVTWTYRDTVGIDPSFVYFDKRSTGNLQIAGLQLHILWLMVPRGLHCITSP